jgi:hypothetical protein
VKPTLCTGPCEQCAVYINRSGDKGKAIRGPAHRGNK